MILVHVVFVFYICLSDNKRDIHPFPTRRLIVLVCFVVRAYLFLWFVLFLIGRLFSAFYCCFTLVIASFFVFFFTDSTTL